MKVAIVRASDLMREGRWDAEFHIALSEVRELMGRLRETYDDEAAIAAVDAVPLADKAALSVLMTGSMPRSMNAADARIVARRYPHLALALVVRDAEAAVVRIREEIARSEAALQKLIELSEARVARLDGLASAV